MSEFIVSLSESLDRFTGIKGSLGYLVIIVCAIVGSKFVNAETKPGNMPADEEEEQNEDQDPLRNFTIAQLKKFNGAMDKQMDEVKPLYLSLGGTVFDVTSGSEYYGPGGPYEMFAGRECGVALAKMSFEEKHMDDVAGCAKLNFGEKDSLQGWIEKFRHLKCYPVMGKLVPNDKLPSPNRVVPKEELKKNNGVGEIPDGYAAAPIYLGAKGKVYDMSFGGAAFYGPGCSYNLFAGKDASRSLALMSFDPSDIENSSIDDLTDKQLKILNDWCVTFEERKGYPCIGLLPK